MTNEQIQAKAESLSINHNCIVHPIVFQEPESDERIVGFLKEPPRHVKLRVLDKGMTSPMTASAEMIDAYLIREDSDARIWDEKPENDKYYLGATMVANDLIKMSINQFKKK